MATLGGQEQKYFSPLGSKLYFHANSSRKNSNVLTPYMAALSRDCKLRILSLLAIISWEHLQLQQRQFETAELNGKKFNPRYLFPLRWLKGLTFANCIL